MKSKIMPSLLQPFMAVFAGIMTTGCASRVLSPTITKAGSFVLDSDQVCVSLLDWGQKYEVQVAVGKRYDDPMSIEWTNSSRIQTSVILPNGTCVEGTPVHSPSIGNAGWFNEIHSYALPLDVRGQLTEVVVKVDETPYSFSISSHQ